MADIYNVVNGITVWDERDVNQYADAFANVLGITDTAQDDLGRIVLPRASAAPSSPSEAQVYYDTDTQEPYFLNASGIWVPFRRGVTVVKEADETINASTGANDDDELFFNVEASAKYAIRGCLGIAGASGTGGIKLAFTGPAGASGWANFDSSAWGGTAANRTGAIFSFSFVQISGSTLADGAMPFTGIIVVAGTAGAVNLQWTQNAANGATTVKAGSWLEYIKLD